VKRGTSERKAHWNKISQKSVDFVLCRKDGSIVAVIEVDDATPGEEGEGSRVSLRKRAFPLVELMDRAAARGVDITWT